MSACSLADLGLNAAGAACELAYSAPFRLLEDDELALVRASIAEHAHAARASDVGAAILPDLAVRDPAVRELVLGERYLARIRAHVPIPVRIHPMGTNLAHVNIQLEGMEVFDWHVDSSPISVVVMISDVLDADGATEVQDAQGRVRSLHYPGAGWAFVLHGSRVRHRARPTRWPERVTLVTSLLPSDPFVRDTKNLDLALHYTDPAFAASDYLAHRLHRLREQAVLLNEAPADLATVSARLELVQHEIADTLRTLAAAQAKIDASRSDARADGPR
jgi:hypothetical protein